MLGLFSALFALAPLVTAEDPVVTHKDVLSGLVLVLDAAVSEILGLASDWFAIAQVCLSLSLAFPLSPSPRTAACPLDAALALEICVVTRLPSAGEGRHPEPDGLLLRHA